MSEQNKIDEIKERLAAAPLLKSKFGTDGSVSVAHDYERDVTYLLAEIERKDEALEFYAEEGNYLEHIVGWGPTIPVVQDAGKRAREAL